MRLRGPTRGAEADTSAGRFSINFAYVQGVARESRIPRERWARHYRRKLERMGGLYVYRNGIRILPYGNTSTTTFLRIEERRNFGAAYYFFSARRMFGAIELPNRQFGPPDREGRPRGVAGKQCLPAVP